MGESVPPQAQATTVLPVGEVIADRYRIDAVVGEGGMGMVYRAEHLHLRKPFAVKVLLREWSSMPEVVARFEREAVAAGNIQSPHVAAATDFGRLADGSFFLVMEFVNGRTLRSLLDEGAVDALRALHMLRGIAAALHAAHSLGIVHRDLKPENVMLIERDGDADFVKVLDFGIAKTDAMPGDAQGGKSAPLTRAGDVIGTPHYMSPEQALGQAVDLRSDLYAAGVILFEMLAGQRPFEGGAVAVLSQHLTADVPALPAASVAEVPKVEAITRRLMAKLPEDRYATAAELVAVLDECVARASSPVLPTPSAADSTAAVTSPSPVRALLERANRTTVMAAAAGAAVLIVLIAVLALRSGGDGDGDTKDTKSGAAAAPAAVGSRADPGWESFAPQPTSSADEPPVTLPPPPSPTLSPYSTSSATTARQKTAPPPSQQSQQGHRTGPGGIYIPPPSQWFK